MKVYLISSLNPYFPSMRILTTCLDEAFCIARQFYFDYDVGVCLS